MDGISHSRISSRKEGNVNNARNRAGRIAFIGISTALALLLSYVEMLLPPIFAAVPGIKVGLPNLVIVYVLYVLGARYALAVSLTRIVLTSILFGNAMTLAYSLAGALLSLLIMVLIKRTGWLSTVGVSVTGGVTHNLGQVLVAAVLLDTPQIAYYMIVLAFTGTVAGIIIGICSSIIIERLPRDKFLF